MEIGFIGVGAMGGGLARNLIRNGKNLAVYDINPQAVEKTVSAGTTGKKADNPGELADVDVLFTSLPMPQDLRDLMLGGSGLISKMKSGAFYIDVSTIDTALGTELNEACLAKGMKFLGCPLGRTPAHAEKAEEPMYAGGKEEDFNEIKPILELIANPVIYLGTCEASYTCKLLGNMMGGVFIAAIAEAFKVAEKVGIDKEVFQKFATESGGDSAQTTVRGPMIVKNDFTPFFRLDLALKDLRLAHKVAEDMGVDAKAFKMARDYFVQASEAGFGNEDAIAVYKVVADK